MRLWLAMLGLTVLPMVGAIFLINTLTPEAPLAAEDRRAWETATAAADLTAAAGDVKARLLGVAADSEVQRLVDGIDSGAERGVVSRMVSSIEGSNQDLVTGACITRTQDGARVPLDVRPGTTSSADTCGSSTLVAKALAAPPGGVVVGTTWGDDRTRRMLLLTELAGTSRRNAGVLGVEVSLRELFAATPSAAGIGTSAVLVDMSNNSIVAASRTDAVISGTDVPGTRPLGNLRLRVSGIVTGHTGTARALEKAGWTATAAPLWPADDGAHFGLIHVWPLAPEAPRDMLVMALVAFAMVVLLIAVIVARTFLQPFDDLAKSQAQLEVLYREARQDSLHDGLTGLGNHRSFQEELDRQLELYHRHRVPVALLLIDLDDLKVVNDGEGHPAGDHLLVSMANAVRDTLRYGDRAFRIGGDEFAVILPHTDADDALVAANRLRHFCLRPAAGERVIPFSGGVSAVPQLAADRNEIFRQADAALYRCKRSGRGTVAIFDPDRDLVPDEASGQGAATAVRDIIRARNLRPVYQPIVDLRDGTVLGFEGLIRPGPSSSFSNPGQLFAAAADAGRTVELDLACFEVVAAGSARINSEQVVTINLSPQTLEMEDFSASWLLEILARYQISPGRVIVELTEREAITDLDRLRRNVAALQRAGVRLAADDVGAGNAGLRLLSQVRFDIMKIDLSLVQDGAQRDASRAVLRSLMDLAARQGAVVIAEGLETAEQLRSLRELGIATGQGYLLGRPGSNLGLVSVEIDELAKGTLIVNGAVPQREPPAAPPSAAPGPPPAAPGLPPAAPASEPTPAAPAAEPTRATIHKADPGGSDALESSPA
jgi:diguanylate cyclase (GGDEF)-like protein